MPVMARAGGPTVSAPSSLHFGRRARTANLCLRSPSPDPRSPPAVTRHTHHTPLQPLADGLDFDAMGWSWGSSYAPTPSDFQGGAIMQQLLADFAVNRGVMPASWGWAPVSPGAPLATYVVAQESGWPGGGSKAIVGWKQRQCQVLAAHLQPMQQWWWCD